MPESTCLHIQDRESGPIRVVELPWISVRIGRAAYCEVRLPDDQVAEEACRLTAQGTHLEPDSGIVSWAHPRGRPAAGWPLPCAIRHAIPHRPVLPDAPERRGGRTRLGNVPGLRTDRAARRALCCRAGANRYCGSGRTSPGRALPCPGGSSRWRRQPYRRRDRSLARPLEGGRSPLQGPRCPARRRSSTRCVFHSGRCGAQPDAAGFPAHARRAVCRTATPTHPHAGRCEDRADLECPASRTDAESAARWSGRTRRPVRFEFRLGAR